MDIKPVTRDQLLLEPYTEARYLDLFRVVHYREYNKSKDVDENGAPKVTWPQLKEAYLDPDLGRLRHKASTFITKHFTSTQLANLFQVEFRLGAKPDPPIKDEPPANPFELEDDGA